MTERAYAKINLTLDVFAKREDGYHDVRTVLQEVSLFDTVSLRSSPARGKGSVLLRLTGARELPTDDHNLCVRAAKAFFDRFDRHDTDVDIDLKKQIPIGAGLGGGSSDAAAVLRMLNRELAVGASDRELEELGAALGADVPFFIRGGTQLAEGFGEKLTPLSFDRREIYVLARPDRILRTPEIFAGFDALAEAPEKTTDPFLNALREGKDPYPYLGNGLSPAAEEKAPEIRQFRDLLQADGAYACLSGSGPTVFGVFRSYFKAQRAARHLQETGKAQTVKTVLPVIR